MRLLRDKNRLNSPLLHFQEGVFAEPVASVGNDKKINVPFHRQYFPIYYVKNPRNSPAIPTFFAL